MRFSLLLEPDARAEFDEAHRYYESVRTGLGKKFRIEVGESLNRIRRSPLSRSIVYRPDVRRVLVSKFPYSIFYRVVEKQIRVLAVFHSSRDPAVWQTRANETDGTERQAVAGSLVPLVALC